MANRFKITFFSTLQFDTFYTYTCNALPLLGNIVEFEAGKTFFQITKRRLIPLSETGTTIYLLYGNFFGERVSRIEFDNLKKRMVGIAIDIELNSYGEVLFPGFLD